MQNYKWNSMTMGTCYYPEHWPKELWESDLDRMKEAGISTIRIAEFAWVIFEPDEGSFSFDFFDEFMELCVQKDMKVILGTPTATPPAWLTEKYPEVLNGTIDGIPYRHGARRHYNYNSEKYRELSARIVEQMAAHYGKHPAVVGWQIDNEINCETDEFYSEADSAAFRMFLKEKYQTLDELNAAWGTAVWSQTYTDWEQIFVPRTVLNVGWNPHLRLDYFRFVSWSARRFCKLQADILRKYKKPGDFITTNGLFGNLDNHQMEDESLDVYTYDSYPSFAFGLDRKPRESTDLNDRKWTRNLIATRSVCPHFGIMEQQSGACGWATRMEGPAPRPGQLTLWAMQSVAQGADFISFFRWRTNTFGTEMYWHGILDYDSRDNRKLAEVKDFYAKLKKLDPLCGAEYTASFGLLRDYDNIWDTRADYWHAGLDDLSLKEIFVASEISHTPYDEVFLREGTTLQELCRYPVLIYPHPMIMTEERAQLLKAYVEQGGTLILGCRSGSKDMTGRFVMLPQPGLLQELTGTDVRDFTCASPNEDPVTTEFNGKSLPVPHFHDVLTPLEGTEVLSSYQGSYYAGEAVLTEKRTGKGRTIHFGGCFDRELVRELFRYTGILEPFEKLICAPEDVQIVGREKDGKNWYFVLNYMDGARTVDIRMPMRSLYTGEGVSGRYTMKPFETLVLEEE